MGGIFDVTVTESAEGWLGDDAVSNGELTVDCEDSLCLSRPAKERDKTSATATIPTNPMTRAVRKRDPLSARRSA